MLLYKSGVQGGYTLHGHVFLMLAENEKALEYIPDGVKENVWVVIENGKNVVSRSKNNISGYALVRHKPMILTFAYVYKFLSMKYVIFRISVATSSYKLVTRTNL